MPAASRLAPAGRSSGPADAILISMDRICPYLALAADGRTAIDGFDAEHRCVAVDPAEGLDRSTQLRLCLTDEHRACDRYQAAQSRMQRESARLPRPAPDAVVLGTRMILEPDPAWRGLNPGRLAGARARRLVVGGAVAVLGLAAIAGGASGGIAAMLAPAATATPSPTPSPTLTPTLTPLPTRTASPTPTIVPTPTLEPTPAPTPSPTPAPTVRTYRVQAGDTLSTIAARFGTTAQAIANANGIALNSIINIGQVLIIP
jgi:LysM domain